MNINMLTRFIFTSRYFSVENKRVKHAAFSPMFNKENERYETSVCRIDDLSGDEIWETGITEVEQRRPGSKKILARGDFTEKCLSDTVLTIENSFHIFNRHADIIGWPNEKDEHLALKQFLANSAILCTRD